MWDNERDYDDERERAHGYQRPASQGEIAIIAGIVGFCAGAVAVAMLELIVRSGIFR